MVIYYRHFGTTCRSHLQGSRNPRKSDFLTLEYGPDWSRNVGNYHYAPLFPRKVQVSKKYLLTDVLGPPVGPINKVGPIGYSEASVKTTNVLRNIPEERRSGLQRLLELAIRREKCLSPVLGTNVTACAGPLLATALLLYRQAEASHLVPEIKTDVFPSRRGV